MDHLGKVFIHTSNNMLGSIAWWTVFIAFINTAIAATQYSVVRNVVHTSVPKLEAFHTTDSFTLSVCTNECTFRPNCTSALYDEHSNVCYLYTTNYLVTTESVGTGLTYMYIEEEPCSWTESCCYATKMNCMSFGPTYKDCQDAFEQGERDSGEVYNLQPDPTWVVIRAVCEFDSVSGWTVIQRRLDGSVDFYRNWANYTDGFGDLNGEYWIGLEAIYHLTIDNRKMSVYMEDHEGESRTANYSTFYVDDAATNYVNHISGYTGDAGNSWNMHDNKAFTTYDRDNDAHGGNCAIKFQGAWWYASCHHVNLNGQWVEGGPTSTFATGINWYHFKGHNYALKTVYIRLGR